MEEQKKKSGKVWIAVLCIVFAIALIGGGAVLVYKLVFNSPDKKYESAMSQAEAFLEEEEYKSAVDSYKEALEYKDDDEDALEGISEAYASLGAGYLNKEDYEKAYSNYVKAYKDVENEEAMKAALYISYYMSREAYRKGDEAFGEWVEKYEEIAEKMGMDDFYTIYTKEAQSGTVGSNQIVEESVDDPNVRVINVWAFTDEVPKMINYYIQTHPDFNYDIRTTIIATTDGLYQPALIEALRAGGADAPDIYCAEASFALRFSQGDASGFAATYGELGLDVENKIKEAEIAPYSVQVGTRPRDGQVVALSYDATGSAFIYNRSVAKATWGTDDPAFVQEKIGGGTGNWDQFKIAAKELRSEGFAIISGAGDIWRTVENSATQGWIVNGQLNIDPKREVFLDISMWLENNHYHNNTQDWTDAWYADMKGEGNRRVLGFFGPAWFINYVMAGNSGYTYGDWAVCESPVGFFWGGTWIFANKDSKVKKAVGEIIEWITLDCTRDGLQYAYANDTLNWDYDYYTTYKTTVTSGKVMKMSDGSLDFLGGQNMFDVYIKANEAANGHNLTAYDETINSAWRDAVRRYTQGHVSREQAIEEFKQNVAARVDVEID